MGVRTPPYTEQITIEGVDYRIREHVSNDRTGYQGTVYERSDTGEIVVAHRGTEEIWKDGVLADGAMVANRTNPQADDAIELTRRAMGYAEQSSRTPGRAPPEVSVTGHSLGGTLAQVSAHYFDLPGETFNAYGAGSLDRRIGEGGDKVVNHGMAGDTVHAASPHYGRVQLYATEREIEVLRQSGYRDNRIADALTPDLPLLAAGRSLGSHSMHHFLPVDGDGKPDTSVIGDRAAIDRAAEHERQVSNFRDDVESLRRGVTVISRGPAGLVRDGVDAIRGPVPAGEPARREIEEAQQSKDGRRASVDVPLEQGDTQFMRELTGSHRDFVSRLLEAAKTDNADAIKAATESVEAGQGWHQRAAQEAKQAAMREEAQQHASQQDVTRHA